MPDPRVGALQNAGDVFRCSCQSREMRECRQMRERRQMRECRQVRELREMTSLPKLCLNPICQGWYNRAGHQTLASDQVAGDNHEDMSSL
jgi:glutamyl/glutaminyl-tRNA synthetase